MRKPSPLPELHRPAWHPHWLDAVTLVLVAATLIALWY